MTREEAKREILFAKREVMADSYIDKAYDMAIKALEQPEIIHCKDCKYLDEDTVFHQYWCRGNRVFVSDDHYCGYAERREDGN